MKHSSVQQGFALLYVMIILSTMVVAVALAASQAGAFSANRIKIYRNAADLRMLTNYCAETLLMQVRNDPTITTDEGSLDYMKGQCSYTIDGPDPTKTIAITATKYKLIERLTIETTQLFPTILATWTETQ